MSPNGYTVSCMIMTQQCGSGAGFDSQNERVAYRGGIVLAIVLTAVRFGLRFDSLAATACHHPD